MGNNPTKEARSASQAEARPAGADAVPSSSSHRPSASTIQSSTSDNGRRRGSSRHDMSLFRIGGHHDPDPSDPTARRETRAEREARKREKERELRAIERERSIKEEGVDGGYLVTLGTYTGPEDFNKTVVRQLMVERRLAPFWKGLQDHEDGWADNQLVAAARGEAIPEPGPTPAPEQLMKDTSTGASSALGNAGSMLAVPSVPTATERPRSPSNPEHSASTLFGSPPASFRTRARTLVSLSTPRNNSQTDMTPTEVRLPRDPYVNGQPLEAFLYKHASECPICFLYYPPYLNKTRCCDQPICSECFVQIKRPDPHPPEHHDDDPNNSNSQPPAEQEYELVSEVATCPFCKQPEFGVTYDPPPFRRGVVYNELHKLGSVMSAMSSSSSVNSQSHSPSSASRRRATSVAADAPNVVTTDIVRPDWRKKLDDARTHALRRAAAATALHNAAYMLGGQGDAGSRIAFGRRRRTLFGDVGAPGSAAQGGLGEVPHLSALLAAHSTSPSAHAGGRQASTSSGGEQAQGQQPSSDLFPGRGSSRRSRIEDLEELMYMEAIRLSLASADEERKKAEKEEAKRQKKEDKQRAKDAKKAAKEAKRSGSVGTVGTTGGGMYASSMNESQASGLAGAASAGGLEATTAPGKGKAPAGSSTTPSPEPQAATASTTTMPKNDPQAFLEQSRANIQPAPPQVPVLSQQQHFSTPSPHRQALRHLSSASSVSSLNDSVDTSPNASALHLEQGASSSSAAAAPTGPYSETPPATEPMFNFRSLAAVIGREDGSSVIEHSGSVGDSHTPSPPLSPGHEANFPASNATPPERSLSAGERLFGVTSPSSPPVLPTWTELSAAPKSNDEQDRDAGERPMLAGQESNPYDAKHYGDISILDSTGAFSPAR